MNNKLMTCIAISLFAFANISVAQTGSDMQVDEEQLSEIFGDKAYSPFAGRTFPARPLWGDSHLQRYRFWRERREPGALERAHDYIAIASELEAELVREIVVDDRRDK